VIAHRLPTIREADQIIVLQKGRIAERGRHDELFAAEGLYARMWQASADSSNWQIGRKREEMTGVGDAGQYYGG